MEELTRQEKRVCIWALHEALKHVPAHRVQLHNAIHSALSKLEAEFPIKKDRPVRRLKDIKKWFTIRKENK